MQYWPDLQHQCAMLSVSNHRRMLLPDSGKVRTHWLSAVCDCSIWWCFFRVVPLPFLREDDANVSWLLTPPCPETASCYCHSSFVCGFTFRGLPTTGPHRHLQSEVWTNCRVKSGQTAFLLSTSLTYVVPNNVIKTDTLPFLQGGWC